MLMFIYLVGFGYRYKICTIGEQRDVDEARLCLGVLQLRPKRRAPGVDADAQPVRYAADAACSAGTGFRIRIRMQFETGWRRIKNLWDYCIPTGKPYSLNTTQPRSHVIEGRATVRGGGPR
jgi:hypothetical protein